MQLTAFVLRYNSCIDLKYPVYDLNTKRLTSWILISSSETHTVTEFGTPLCPPLGGMYSLISLSLLTDGIFPLSPHCLQLKSQWGLNNGRVFLHQQGVNQHHRISVSHPVSSHPSMSNNINKSALTSSPCLCSLSTLLATTTTLPE